MKMQYETTGYAKPLKYTNTVVSIIGFNIQYSRNNEINA